MSRHTQPISLRRPKESKYWYAKLAGWRAYKSTGCTSKGDALFEAQKWLQDPSRAPSSSLLLRQFLASAWSPDDPHIQRILADGKRISSRYVTDQRRRLITHVLTDPIADIQLRALRRGHFEDLKRRLRDKGVGPRTINLTLQALSVPIREGFYRQQLDLDPLSGVGRVAEDPRERGIFTRFEYYSLFLERPEIWGYDPAHSKTSHYLKPYTFALLMAATGERPSAFYRIRWHDLRDHLLTFPLTKTATARTIPLISRVVQALQSLRDDSLRSADDDFVFADDSGVVSTPTWMRKRFFRALDAAGLPATDPDGRVRTLYSLKHSFITHLLDAGADEILVREYVGHSHDYGASRLLTRTQARYRHGQIERLRELLPLIDALFADSMAPFPSQ